MVRKGNLNNEINLLSYVDGSQDNGGDNNFFTLGTAECN